MADPRALNDLNRIHPGGGQVLDVFGASVDDDARRIIQYTPHGGTNQEWLLVGVV